MKNKNIKIVQAEAKDIYLANHTVYPNPMGYRTTFADGNVNTRRFTATLPYSLDQIQLREVYRRIMRNERFSFLLGHHEYTNQVVSIKFNLSVKLFNKIEANTLIKVGYLARDMEFEDSACIRDGELIGVQINRPVEHPISAELLGKSFKVVDGMYQVRTSMPTVVSVSDLRKYLYENGAVVEGIPIVRWKRSPGSARVGKCLFINAVLFKAMARYDRCGIDLHAGQKIDLAAWESYSSLTSSGIVGLLDINPRNVLLVDDCYSVFKSKVAAAENDENGKAHIEFREVDVENCIFDGESLIEKSAMGKYSEHGFILLRHRFFKTAAFNCNLQQWFADNGITCVSQLNGKTLATDLSEIKLVTTPSSLKYLKFGDFDQWVNNVGYEPFAVVKYEKPTKFFDGRLAQCNYQVLNTLDLSPEEVAELVKPSLDYVRALKTNPAVMRYHLKLTLPGEAEEIEDEDYVDYLTNRNEVIFKLLCTNDEFTKTKLYYDFRKDIVASYVSALKRGRILVRGQFLTMCGNGAEFLLHTIGKYNGVPIMQPHTVMTTRFDYGKELLGARSPHINPGNILITTNTRYDIIEQYFNSTSGIVYVNSVGENILNRLSGADYDSDTVLLMDEPLLLNAAKKHYDQFEVPTSLLTAKKNTYYFTRSDQAKLDTKTKSSIIGRICNLAQELNSLLWDTYHNGESLDGALCREIYMDSVMLDVMSGAAIDSAKREYDIDLEAELSAMYAKYRTEDEDGRKIRPAFFKPVAVSKGYRTDTTKYKHFGSTMDMLVAEVRKFRSPRETPCVESLTKTLDVREYVGADYYHSQLSRVMSLIREYNAKIDVIWAAPSLSHESKREMVSDMLHEVQRYINGLTVTDSTAYHLVRQIEREKNADIKRFTTLTLFGSGNTAFYRILAKSSKPIQFLQEDDDGDINLYGFTYKTVTKKAFESMESSQNLPCL